MRVISLACEADFDTYYSLEMFRRFGCLFTVFIFIVTRLFNIILIIFRYGEHLVSFYVLHPTFWLKLAETVVSAFMSDSKRVFEKV